MIFPLNFQIFTGNTETNTVIENRLPHVILARFLRIIPDLWHSEPTLRMEIIGSYLGEFFINH